MITNYASFKPSVGEISIETIYDDAQGHYEMMYSGWIGWERIHGAVIHVDIRGEKVWIQHDGTEGGIANDSIEAGVPEKHIVLAFHHPSKRQYTGCAVS